LKNKLSKYFHFIPLKNNIYALYNSLLMDVIYVDRETKTRILNFDVTSDEREELCNCGIYITDDQQDIDALELIKSKQQSIQGKVQVMYLILTSQCNLACKYCFIENCTYNNHENATMKEEAIKNSINKFIEYTSKNNINEPSIILYGGEPTINWNAIELVADLVKNTNIKVSMVTNATLLTQKKAKFLAENDIEIGISIDGPKKLNDKNRIFKIDNSSVYDNVLDKIELLRKENCKFGLSITVSKEFLNYQDEVLKWLSELNVTSIFYNLYHYTEYEEDWEEYYKKASEFIIRSYEFLTNKGIYDGRLDRKLESVLDSQFKFADCAATSGNQLTIKPNGDVCVCHGYFKTNKYVIGNINTESIEEIVVCPEFDFWKTKCTIYNKKCL